MRQSSRRKLLTGTGFERAAAYVGEPADETSIETDEQALLVDDWARRHQSTVVEWYFDAAESASRRLAERPGGRALLDATRSGAYDSVVVTALDVFGSSAEIVIDAIKALTREDIPVMAVRGGMSPALRLAWDGLQVFPGPGPLDPDGGEPTLN